MTAVRGDWKNRPLPAARERLGLDRTYTRAEFERLIKGIIPRQMEDKWFVFFEKPWLYLHRSWTGFCIYQVRFRQSGNKTRIVEVLVNRDPEQYRSADGSADALLLAVLLDGQAGRPTDSIWKRYRQTIRGSSE